MTMQSSTTRASERWFDGLQSSSLSWLVPQDLVQRKVQLTAHEEHFGQFTSEDGTSWEETMKISCYGVCRL
ncbi:hypothetical protein Droror1_Dr00027212, partial [Drosera rotundifolia]